MDRLVRVSVSQLEIDFRPAARCTAGFVVTNLMHTMSVAVHLTPGRPEGQSHYSVSPVTPTLLSPLSSAAFTLTLTAPTDRPPILSPADTLLVRSAVVPTGKPDPARLRRLFSVPGVHVFKDANIPIFLVGPHVLDHLLLSETLAAETLEFSFLVSRAISSCSPSDLSAVLRRSAAAGKPGFVSELLSAGADPGSRGSDGRSAVSLAVSSGSLACVEHLVRAGAEVDLELDRVFHEAAAANRTDMIAVLERAVPASSAWAEAVDPGGRTPVHYAAANGHLDALRACLGSGRGDPDRADSGGWTPLHCAASGGFGDAVELLIGSSSYDPKLAVTSDGRKSPLDLAAEGGHSHLYDVLGLSDDLFRAAACGDLGMVQRCLLLGAGVDRRDQNGWTPLHRAAFKGRTRVVEFLIDNGAKVDAVDDVGFTPLRCAARAGRTETVMVLIDRGSRHGLKGIKGADDLFSMKLDNCGGADHSIVPCFCFDSGMGIGT